MHENAHRHFVSELRAEDSPDTFTRVVVHGRFLSPVDGMWYVVVTDIVAGELISYWGDVHGATGLVYEGEFLTWGGVNEPLKVEKLKIVNREGVHLPHPGWLHTGYKTERGKVHADHYQFAGVDTPVGCGRETSRRGGVDASWYMSQGNACKDCQKSVQAVINKM